MPANRTVSLLYCRLKTNLFTVSYHILPTESYPLCSTHSNCSKIPSIRHLGSYFTSCGSLVLALCGQYNATVIMEGLFVILAIWELMLMCVLSNFEKTELDAWSCNVKGTAGCEVWTFPLLMQFLINILSEHTEVGWGWLKFVTKALPSSSMRCMRLNILQDFKFYKHTNLFSF